MVNYSDIFPLSGSGGANFAVLINEATTLTNTGYYYSNNLTSDININCVSLTTGEKVLWFNDSVNDVVFNGLTSVDGVSIPENKGVKIEAGNFVEFTVSSTGVITKQRGNHIIDWKAGYTPPYLTFTYASPGDTNGIIYYLGAIKPATSFANPHTSGEVTIASSGSNGVSTPQAAIDRLNNTSVNESQIWRSTAGASAKWWEIAFNGGKTARINRFELLAASQNYDLGSYWFGSPVFQGWNGSAWVGIHSGFTTSGGTNTRWNSGIFTNNTFYNKYRFYWASVWEKAIGDIEFYGDMYA